MGIPVAGGLISAGLGVKTLYTALRTETVPSLASKAAAKHALDDVKSQLAALQRHGDLTAQVGDVLKLIEKLERTVEEIMRADEEAPDPGTSEGSSPV